MDNAATKIVYLYNTNGLYKDKKVLNYTDRSPISGGWQIPAGCTESIPPAAKDGYDIIWNGYAWEYKEQEKTNDTQNDELTQVNNEKQPAEPSFSDRLAAVEDALNSRLME